MASFITDSVRGVQSFLPDDDQYDRIGAQSITGATDNRINTIKNNARTSEEVLMAKAKVQQYKKNARAAAAVGSAKANSTLVSSVVNGLEGLDFKSAFAPKPNSYSFSDFSSSMISNPFS